MAHRVEVVFVFEKISGTAIVLARSDELDKRPVHFSALLRKSDGRELPVSLNYIFVSGPKVDRSKVSYGVSGIDSDDVAVGDEIVLGEIEC